MIKRYVKRKSGSHPYAEKKKQELTLEKKKTEFLEAVVVLPDKSQERGEKQPKDKKVYFQ